MIDSLVVHVPCRHEETLISNLVKHCPDVKITGVAHTHHRALDMIDKHKPRLLFYDLDMDANGRGQFLDAADGTPCSTILLADTEVNKSTYARTSIAGLVHRPINVADLVVSVRNAIDNLTLQESERIHGAQPLKDVVGIPTMDGFEYVNVSHIVHCEGLQKCTRVVTTDRKDIISAYPIGAFKKLLVPLGFYEVHRSHLVNLSRVIRYSREGFIYLDEGSAVPLSRRKRAAFLASWNQL